MKYLRTLSSVALIALFLSAGSVFAQGHHGGFFNPDSLVPVTVSGTAIVDTTHMHSLYFLDEDGDGNADYILNFGPFWYHPDSSNATRPNDGDAITIYGGKRDSLMNNGILPMIVVYEINGLFWRDPYDPFWTHNGHHGGGGGGGHGHHAFGWMHDSLVTVTLNGIAMVDTTFMFTRYYLDTDQDSVPDYFLNFGPPWYQPPSGATRPNDGDLIDILGGKAQRDSLLPVVVVYEINGLLWRDSSAIGPQFGGGWIHRYMNQSRFIHTPWDSLSGMRFNPGWHNGGGHHGGMMPDDLFCQTLALYPQNMPGNTNQKTFAGFEMGIFGPTGQNLLMPGGMMGGHMHFNSPTQIQLHYNDIQLQGFNIDESTIAVEVLDETTNTWTTVSNVVVNTTDNTVTFTTNDLNSFYALTGQENVLSIGEGSTLLSQGFELEQNYPNPFNPSTNIAFRLNNASQVVLTVYNVLGQQITELLNGKMDAGVHSVQFNAATLPTGIYFYELKVDGNSQIRKMNLIK